MTDMTCPPQDLELIVETGEVEVSCEEMYSEEGQLRQWHLVEEKSLGEIAKMTGVGRRKVEGKMKKYNIPIVLGRPRKRKYNLDREQLFTLYVTEWKSLAQVAETLGTSVATVRRSLKHYGISTRGPGEARSRRSREDLPLSKEQLYTWYIVEQKTLANIAEISGIERRVIRRMMDTYEINVRTKSEIRSHKNRLDNAQLYQYYVLEKKSLSEIGEICGASRSSVRLWMKQAGIPRRNQQEVQQQSTQDLELMITSYLQHVAEGNDIDFESYCKVYREGKQ